MLHNETVEDDQECKNSESKDRVEDKLKICHKKRKRSNIEKKKPRCVLWEVTLTQISKEGTERQEFILSTCMVENVSWIKVSFSLDYTYLELRTNKKVLIKSCHQGSEGRWKGYFFYSGLIGWIEMIALPLSITDTLKLKKLGISERWTSK